MRNEDEVQQESAMVDMKKLGSIGRPEPEHARAMINTPDIPDGSLLKSLFMEGTSVGGLLRYQDRGSYTASDDPYGFLQFVPDMHMNRFDAYALVTNQEEADAITLALNREYEDKARIAAAPLKSFFYGLAVQPLDPVNYMPGSTIWKGYKGMSLASKSVLAATTSGILSTVTQEAVLQQTQLTREVGESISNTLAAGIFSATISGASVLTGPGLKRLRTSTREYAINELTETIDGVAKKLTKDGTIDPNNPIFPKPVQGLLRLSKRNRMSKSELPTAKEVANEIFASDLAVEKNMDGTPSKNVERVVALDIGLGNEGLIKYENIFFEQAGVKRGIFGVFDGYKARKAATEDPSGQILNWEQFEKAVSWGVISGEKHPNPHVNKAVDLFMNEVINPLSERAIAAGLLEDGVTPKNAVNYYSQHIDSEVVARNQPEFKSDLTGWYTEINEVNKQVRSTSEFKQVDKELTSVREQLKKSMKGKTVSKEQSKKVVSKSKEEIKKAEMEIKIIRRENEAIAKAEIEPLQEQIKVPKQELVEIKNQIQKLSTRRRDLRERQNVLRERLKSAKEGSKTAKKIQVELDKFSGVIVEIDKNMKSFRRERDVLSEKIKGISDQINNWKKQGKVKDANELKLEEKIKELEARIKKEQGKTQLNEKEKAELKLLKDAEKILKEKLASTVRDVAGRILDPTEVEGLLHTQGEKAGELRAVSTEAEIIASVDQTLARVLGNDTSKINSDVIRGLQDKPSQLKQRTLLISQKKLYKWMDQSPSSVAGKYLRSMAPAVRMTEMAKELGFNSIQEWRNKRVEALTAEYKERVSSLEGDKALKLDKEYKRQKENITESFNMMLGVYGDGPNVHDGSMAKFYKTMLDWNYIRLLGAMTLSAIADLGMHVFTHGIYATIHDGLVPVFKQMAGTLKTFSKDDLRAINMAHNTVSGSRLRSIASNDMANTPSYFGKVFDRMVETFGNVSLMNQWNDMQQLIAGTMSINRSLKTIEQIATGRNVKADDRIRLAKLGISESEAVIIHDMWKRAGKPQEGGTYFADWVNWKTSTKAELDALQSFQAATMQEIKQVVVEPTMGDKPDIAYNGWGKLLLQFKTFAFAATNKVTFSGLQRVHDKNMWFGLATMAALGGFSYVITQVARGNDDIDLSFEKLVQESFDRSGMLGIIGEVWNLANKAGLGFGSASSRYQSRGLWGAILGPTTGLVEDILGTVNRIRSANDESPLTTDDLQKMARLAPYQNLFYIYYLNRQVMKFAGPSIGFGEPASKNPYKDLFKD